MGYLEKPSQTGHLKVSDTGYTMPKKAAKILGKSVAHLPDNVVPQFSMLWKYRIIDYIPRQKGLFESIQHYKYAMSEEEINFLSLSKYRKYMSAIKTIASWLRGQSWLDTEWFMEHISATMLDHNAWIDVAEVNLKGHVDCTRMIAQIISRHPDSKSVIEMISTVAHYNRVTADRIAQSPTGKLHPSVWTFMDTLPRAEQWQSALFGENDITEDIIDLPAPLVLSVVSSL
jgi:hypothetical protein